MLSNRVAMCPYVTGGGSSGPFENDYNYLFGGNITSSTYANYLDRFDGTTRTTSGSTLSQSKSSTQVTAYLPSQTADFMFGGTMGVFTYSTVTEKWNGTTRSTTTAVTNSAAQSNARYTNGNDYYHVGVGLYKWTGTTHSLAVTGSSLASQYAPSAYYPSTDVSYTFGGPGKYVSTAIIKWNGTAESTETATMPAGTDGAGCCYLTDSTMYISGGLVGGAGGSVSNVIRKWNGSTITTETATLSGARRTITSSFIDDVIYSYGGFDGSDPLVYHNNIEEWNGTSRTTSSATLQTNMAYVSCAEL